MVAPTEPSTRERQRLDTRRRIYEAAEPMIRADGLAALSIAQVAKVAGVSRQTVYDHFPTNETFIDEALARYRHRVVTALAATVPDGADLPQTLHAVVDALFGSMEPGRGRLRQEISAHLARGAGPDESADEPLRRTVIDAVERAEASGAIVALLGADETATLLLTALSGSLRFENQPRSRRIAHAHATVDLLVRGLGRPS